MRRTQFHLFGFVLELGPGIWAKANQKLSCLSHQTLVLVYLLQMKPSHKEKKKLFSVNLCAKFRSSCCCCYSSLQCHNTEGSNEQVIREMNSVSNYSSCQAFFVLRRLPSCLIVESEDENGNGLLVTTEHPASD